MRKQKVLIADDNPHFAKALKFMLLDSFSDRIEDIIIVRDGDECLKELNRKIYDMVFMDINMPKKDGFTLAKEIRMVNTDVPIIFLTAKSMKEDIFQGFKIGADDYIAKPFSMEELLFRIEAILRRTKGGLANQEVFQLGKFKFDTQKQQLIDGEKVVKLTTKESELLKLLCNNANKVLERNFALKTIWMDDNYFNARSMDVYIARLRKKLKEDRNVSIVNVHRMGFKLEVSHST